MDGWWSPGMLYEPHAPFQLEIGNLELRLDLHFRLGTWTRLENLGLLPVRRPWAYRVSTAWMAR